MNKKAEAFIKYLDNNKITCFAIEQISEDKLNTVVFRSHIVVEGPASADAGHPGQQYLWYASRAAGSKCCQREQRSGYSEGNQQGEPSI